MGEDADNFWEAMGLEDVEEFKSFLLFSVMMSGGKNLTWRKNEMHHLESKRTIHHE